MLRQFVLWALICSTATAVCAREYDSADLIGSDTIEYSISSMRLDGITVTASAVINKNDRKVIRPDKVTINSSTGGADLLRKLQLAGIAISPLTGEITAAGGGNVVLCINGVESTSAQISALRPKDIQRIEFHDNPGVRYAGAAAVIDFIISRHDAGGSLMLDAFGAFASGRYASIDHFAGQYNRGRSVWSVNVGFMGQRKDKWIRDYEETWRYPEATVVRQETGLPVKVGGAGLGSTVNYNYLHPRGDMFNLRLGFDFNDEPDSEEGDRHGMLVTSDAGMPVEIIEHTEQRSLRPNISAYYQHKLDDNRNITVEAAGSYLRSEMLHAYSEGAVAECSRVKGEMYSLNVRGMFERRHRSSLWNIGVSHRSSFISNIYNPDCRVKVALNRWQTSLFGEYSCRFGNWGAMGSLRAVYNHIGQDTGSLDRLFALPAANVTYRPSGKWFLRYGVEVDYVMPSAAEISNVEQPVQTGMIRRGNPELKPFRVVEQSFTASFEHTAVRAEARVEYRKESKPVMESVIFENGRFVRTFFNQRSFHRLLTGFSVTVRPWQEHLSITAEPMLKRYFSYGIDYSHTHSIFRLGISVDFNCGNWLAYGNIMSGPANKMYGEEIIEEKDMNQIMVGYKWGKWSLHVGVFNAFVRNYRMETRNLSALTPYRSIARSARSSSYIAVKFNLALDFGSKGRQVELRPEETDKDSGILTGTR